jgi:molybdopterin molybdotransferase
MAQLSDDCFAFGGPMMSVDEAVAIIAARVTAVQDVETVALGEADGRVLARDISAPVPLPPFTNSAVDGYAVRSVDLPQGKEQAFPVTGRVQAGSSAQAPIKPGHAMRIFTGAPMPDGADTVFMQEDVRLDENNEVVLPAGLRPGANVRPAGEDIPMGRSALAAGQRLRPQDIALAAAFGLTQLDVRRRIRVAVFSTGNELVSPGTPRGAAQLYDSNRFMLTAMLARLGCEVSDLGIVSDDRASLAQGLKKVAGTHDLILTTGGVSTGEEDHVKASVESLSPARRSSACREIRWRVLSPLSMWCVRPCWRWRAPVNSIWFQCRCARPLLTKRRSPAANMFGSICARAMTARSKPSNSRARGRDCCRRWWTPMASSNSAKRSHRSNRARR